MELWIVTESVIVIVIKGIKKIMSISVLITIIKVILYLFKKNIYKKIAKINNKNRFERT